MQKEQNFSQQLNPSHLEYQKISICYRIYWTFLIKSAIYDEIPTFKGGRFIMLKLLDKFLSKSQSPFSLKTLFHWSVVIHDFFVRFDHGAVTSFIRCLAPIFRICLKNIRLTGGSTI